MTTYDRDLLFTALVIGSALSLSVTGIGWAALNLVRLTKTGRKTNAEPT